MRIHHRLVLLALAIACAALPATAAASKSASARASARVAAKAATATAGAIADAWQDADGNTIDDYDLSPCDRAGAFKFTCDVTYSLSDGSTCDDTIRVSLTGRRHTRLRTRSDSDSGDTQVFKDCAPAEDDPSADDPGADDPALTDPATP